MVTLSVTSDEKVPGLNKSPRYCFLIFITRGSHLCLYRQEGEWIIFMVCVVSCITKVCSKNGLVFLLKRPNIFLVESNFNYRFLF